jgi:tetratricopeptide (TPR) repeat protein
MTDDAEVEARAALTVAEGTFGSLHPRTALALQALAQALDAKGREEEADACLRRALAIREEVFLGNPGRTLSETDLAALSDLSQSPRVLELWERELACAEDALGPDRPEIVPELRRIAAQYLDLGFRLSCRALYRRVLAIHEQALGADHPQLAEALIELADRHEEDHDYATAEPLYQRAHAIRELAFGGDHPQVAVILTRLGGPYLSLEEDAQAEAFLARALAIQEQALPPDHEDLGETLRILGYLYARQGKSGEAQALAARADAISGKAPFQADCRKT